jgi:hypothetical protein
MLITVLDVMEKWFISSATIQSTISNLNILVTNDHKSDYIFHTQNKNNKNGIPKIRNYNIKSISFNNEA